MVRGGSFQGQRELAKLVTLSRFQCSATLLQFLRPLSSNSPNQITARHRGLLIMTKNAQESTTIQSPRLKPTTNHHSSDGRPTHFLRLRLPEAHPKSCRHTKWESRRTQSKLRRGKKNNSQTLKRKSTTQTPNLTHSEIYE